MMIDRLSRTVAMQKERKKKWHTVPPCSFFLCVHFCFIATVVISNSNHHPNLGVVCQGVTKPPKMYGTPFFPATRRPTFQTLLHCLQLLAKTTHGLFFGGFLFIILLMPWFGVRPSFQRFNFCLNVFSFTLHQILGHLVLFFVARKDARAVLPFLLLGRVVQPHET